MTCDEKLEVNDKILTCVKESGHADYHEANFLPVGIIKWSFTEKTYSSPDQVVVHDKYVVKIDRHPDHHSSPIKKIALTNLIFILLILVLVTASLFVN